MKIAENEIEYNPPIDAFKKTHVPQDKKKFMVVEKVNNTNHWKKTDKVGDPEHRNGWKPNLKWSDKESTYRCEGRDKAFRTFEKIINNQRKINAMNDVRE